METSEKVFLKTIREKLDVQESGYSSVHATPNSAGVRREAEEFLTEGYRQAFSADADRILHSRGYARYIDKTQVFYLIRNDHITHRVLHVQLVSQIGRGIGRFLGLKVIEAGGVYMADRKLWALPLGKVVKLGLIDRLKQ